MESDQLSSNIILQVDSICDEILHEYYLKNSDGFGYWNSKGKYINPDYPDMFPDNLDLDNLDLDNKVLETSICFEQ